MPVHSHKATSDHILHDFEGGSFDAALETRIERDAVLVTDGRQAYIGLAEACGVEHVKVVARAGERVVNGFHIQNVNAYASRLKDWLRPFRGVASKYLATYLGWRRMIERDGYRLTPRHVIGQAAAA